MPSSYTVEHRSRILPGTASTVGPSLRSQDHFDQLPLGIAESPSSSHALLVPTFPHTGNSRAGSTAIYETSSWELGHLYPFIARKSTAQIRKTGGHAVIATRSYFCGRVHYSLLMSCFASNFLMLAAGNIFWLSGAPASESFISLSALSKSPFAE